MQEGPVSLFLLLTSHPFRTFRRLRRGKSERNNIIASVRFLELSNWIIVVAPKTITSTDANRVSKRESNFTNCYTRIHT